MRSLRKKITMLVAGSMVLLTICLILISYSYYKSNEFAVQEANARGDLLTAEELFELKCPGPWQIRNGDLYKGQVEINNNFVIVDYIERVTEAICVVFMNNSCVATSVFDEGGCNRAIGIGTYALREGIIKTLDGGRCYSEQAEIMGKMYQTAYKPITNEDGQIIGLLYIGVPLDNNLFYESLKLMGITGLILALLVGLITNRFVNRRLNKPLQEVIKRMQEIAKNRIPQPLIGSSDIRELSQTFNQMLGAIAVRLRNNGLTQTDQEHELTTDSCSDNCTEEDVDKWIEDMLGFGIDDDELPKGLSYITLKQIILFFKQNKGDDITVESASNALSLSKVTVRRYFNFLEEHDLVDIEQRYGSVGRPLKVYTLKE